MSEAVETTTTTPATEVATTETPAVVTEATPAALDAAETAVAAAQTEQPAPTGPLVAGNTAESLASVSRDDAAGATATETAPPTSTGTPVVVVEPVKPQETTPAVTGEVSAADFLDEENTFDVSRAEFNELLDSFLRLTEAVSRFNASSGHKIQ